MRLLLLLALIGCARSEPAPPADAPVDIPAVGLRVAPACPVTEQPPCVVEVVSALDPAEIAYRLCCPLMQTRIVALAVDSVTGPWGDVTKWALCGLGYVDEFTDSNRAGSAPWAVLSTYDGNGGEIRECKTAGAP